MAVQLGLSFLFEVDSDGAGTYLTAGGGQTYNLSLDRQLVDITSQDDTSRYRQGLSGAGIKTLDADFQGVFKDASADLTIRQYFSGDTHRNWRITCPSFATFVGPMAITNITYGATHDKEITVSFKLASVGDFTITNI